MNWKFFPYASHIFVSIIKINDEIKQKKKYLYKARYLILENITALIFDMTVIGRILRGTALHTRRLDRLVYRPTTICTSSPVTSAQMRMARDALSRIDRRQVATKRTSFATGVTPRRYNIFFARK